MLLDKQNLFSDKQTLAFAAGSVLSTNTIDLGATGTVPGLGGSPISDPGRSEVGLVATITEAVNNATSVKAELVMADNAALSSNLVVLQDTGAIAIASLVPGYQFRFSGLPPGINKRYLGMRYTNVGTTPTTGAVTAGIVINKQTNPSV